MVTGYLKEKILQINKFEHLYKIKYYLCTRTKKGRPEPSLDFGNTTIHRILF